MAAPAAPGTLAGPSLDALRGCVHCGICLPPCPTYRLLGEEMDSPRGRLYLMRALAEGRAEVTPGFTRHMDLCLGCRACEAACPSGVPFGSLLEETRARLDGERQAGRARALESVIYGLFPHPRRLGAALAAARAYRRSGLQGLVRRSALLRRLPGLAALDELLETVPASAPVPELTPAEGRRRGRAGFLTGCVQRHLFAGTNHATVRLLALAGYDVVAPRAQGCCGALELHAGRVDALRARARALAAVFPDDLEVVVTAAAGCGSAMREYGHWLDDPAVVRLAARTRDVSEVLADAELPLGLLELTVTYHDACHLVHAQRVRTAPRQLLARIPGLRLVELADSELCCGSAGVYNVLEPAMAGRLLDLKIERIRETGASVVAAGNPGCLMQIARGARARGLALEVVHPVDLLARSAAARDGA